MPVIAADVDRAIFALGQGETDLGGAEREADLNTGRLDVGHLELGRAARDNGDQFARPLTTMASTRLVLLNASTG